jgi:hypothetical protein
MCHSSQLLAAAGWDLTARASLGSAVKTMVLIDLTNAQLGSLQILQTDAP